MNKPEKFYEVLDFFERIYSIEDEILQEYELIRAAQALDIPIEDVKSLFGRYRFQRLKSEAPLWRKPFFHAELFFEKLNNRLSEMDFFKVLDTIGRLSILVGVIFFVLEIPERAERRRVEEMQTRYQAWQIVIAGQERRSSSGRIDALQVLNEDEVSLTGLDAENAYLGGIELPFADLSGANLREANLKEANLEGADLDGANLGGANLEGVNLQGGNLSDANLREANLKEANLEGADLDGADFESVKSWEDTILANIDLTKTFLSWSGFYKANLVNTAFAGVTFTNFSDIDGVSLTEEDELKRQALIKKILNDSFIEQTGLEERIIQDADFIWRQALVGVDGRYLSLPSTQEQVNTIRRFALRLAAVQKSLNSPLLIHTWYITPLVRERGGFATRSNHLKGYAVMFTVQGMTNREAYDKLSWWQGGLCFSDDYLRIDDRSQKVRYECTSTPQ